MMSDVQAVRPRSDVQRRRHHYEVWTTAFMDAWAAGLFLGVAALLGGSSRFVLLPYLILQLLSVTAIGYALWRLTPERRAKTRPVAWGVLVVAGLMTAQLIPLPPEVWAALPGRDYYADALQQVGLADRWRPLSMTPELTQESLLSMLPVLAAAMLFAPLDFSGRRLLLDALLLCILTCGLVFVFQVSIAGSSFYDMEGRGGGGGLFANRNHLALFLACGIVVTIGRWRLVNRRGIGPAMLALAAVVVTLAFLIVNGSRAGLIAGAAAAIVAGIVFGRSALAGYRGWRRFAIPVVALSAIIAVFTVGTLSTRHLSVERLFQTGATLSTTELRTANFPAVIETAKTFFPVGAGFGGFDPVFRRFESNALLRPTYFNHAHNDLAELLIEGGLPAILLLIIMLIWLARRCMVLLSSTSTARVVTAQIGVLGLAILGLGSLVDYPLRTPFLAVVAILFITLVTDAARMEQHGGRSGVGLGTDDAMR